MADDYAIRLFRPGDEHGILALFNRVFAVGNPDFVPRPLHHWQWEFERNPEGHPTMVAEAGGAIVGTFTAIPARFRFPDGVFRLGQAVDTVVAPEYRQSLRKSGLYLTLAHAWYDHFGKRSDIRFLYGFPNPQAFRIGTRLSGYEPVRCPVLESSLPIEAAAQWREDRVHVVEIERFGGELDRLDAALAPKMGIAAVRDAKYWNWRFPDCTTTRYRLLRAESAATGRLRGFLVHGFSWHGFRKDVAPIVDWVIAPGDRPTWRALLGEAARSALQHTSPKLTDLLTWAPPAHGHFADLAQLGFASKETIFNLCIRRFPDSDITAEESRERLYINMGDSDIF
jgi:hypothetical protein